MVSTVSTVVNVIVVVRYSNLLLMQCKWISLWIVSSFRLVNVALMSLILNIIARLTVWCVWIVGLTFVRYLQTHSNRTPNNNKKQWFMTFLIPNEVIIISVKIDGRFYLRIVAIFPVGSVSNDLCSPIGQLNTVFATRHITIAHRFVWVLVRRGWITDCIVEGKWHSGFMMVLVYAGKEEAKRGDENGSAKFRHCMERPKIIGHLFLFGAYMIFLMNGWRIWTGNGRWWWL